MKIVAGRFGSRKLQTLKGSNTRPTSSKVRAAVFDHYGTFFNGGFFLDMFAGSGAMGLEAISRGFDEATFIEQNYKAMKVVKENIQTLGVAALTKCYQGDALKQIESLKKQYDLIFIDPPYAYDMAEELLEKVIKLELLKPNGYCVFETDQDLQEVYPGLKCYQVKSYGDTKLYFYERA